MKHKSPFVVVTLLALAALACGVGVDQEATAAALQEAIAQTQAAGAETVAESEPNTLVQTAEAVATVASISATQAQVEAEAAAAEEAAATAAFEQPIRDELPSYGVDPAAGRVGWVHPPVSLDIDGYLQYDYVNQYIGTVATDFVMAADITWNTFTGLSGCGFGVRASGDEKNFSGYLALASRGALGQVGFIVMQENEPVAGKEVYAGGIDPAFEWQNDTTNRLAVVGRGDTFTVFSNGVQLGAFSAPEMYRYDRGFVAMVGLSESGLTHCAFTNAWLWLIDPEAAGPPPPLGTIVPESVGLVPPSNEPSFPSGMLCGLPFLPVCP